MVEKVAASNRPIKYINRILTDLFGDFAHFCLINLQSLIKVEPKDFTKLLILNHNKEIERPPRLVG